MVDAYSSPRIITILDVTDITIQNLYNAIRKWEQEPAYMSYDRLVVGAGKQDLGSDTYVGITMTLQNAKIKFEDQIAWTICTVSGGNLVAVDANNVAMSPIEPATYVNVVLAQSSSATLLASESEWTSEEKSLLLLDIETIRQLNLGRWKIINNQMIFYQDDNLTEIARFNLFNQQNQPSMKDVFDRVKV